MPGASCCTGLFCSKPADGARKPDGKLTQADIEVIVRMASMADTSRCLSGRHTFSRSRNKLILNDLFTEITH